MEHVEKKVAFDPHKAAERLCVEAEKIGLDGPTEAMISERLLDIHENALLEAVYEVSGLSEIVTKLRNALQTVEDDFFKLGVLTDMASFKISEALKLKTPEEVRDERSKEG